MERQGLDRYQRSASSPSLQANKTAQSLAKRGPDILGRRIPEHREPDRAQVPMRAHDLGRTTSPRHHHKPADPSSGICVVEGSGKPIQAPPTKCFVCKWFIKCPNAYERGLVWRDEGSPNRDDHVRSEPAQSPLPMRNTFHQLVTTEEPH